MDAELTFWLVELGVAIGVAIKIFAFGGSNTMSDEWKKKH